MKLVLPFLDMRKFKTTLPEPLHLYSTHLGNFSSLMVLLSLSLLEICPPLHTLRTISPVHCSFP